MTSTPSSTMSPPNGDYEISHLKSHLMLIKKTSAGAEPAFKFIFSIDIDSPEVRDFANSLGDSERLQFREYQSNDAVSGPLFHVHYFGEDLVLTITKLENNADDRDSPAGRFSNDEEDNGADFGDSLRLLFGEENPESDHHGLQFALRLTNSISSPDSVIVRKT